MQHAGAGHAHFLGDVFQRALRGALLTEHLGRGTQNRLAFLLRFRSFSHVPPPFPRVAHTRSPAAQTKPLPV